MSKNAEGWIRHRGGKRPVDVGARIDIRCRDGRVNEGVVCGGPNTRTSNMFWRHDGDGAEVMAYRLHKPAEQVEQVEAEQVMRDCVEKCASTESAGELLYDPIAQGPLQWRDRITELDEERKTIDVLYQVNTARIETERAELVQKLAGEGFALTGRVVEPVEDHGSIQVGDMVSVVSVAGFAGNVGLSIGDIAEVTSVDNDGSLKTVAGGSWGSIGYNYKFHSRPSA